jgi:T5SS/PEP-CTERM-associated repeat protein
LVNWPTRDAKEKALQSRTIRAVIAVLAGALGLSLTPAARSQYTTNFQINISSGMASNWSGDYVVGSNTFADVLFVQNSAVLANGNGYLGYEASGNNNLAAVIGSGSVWSNGGSLYIGNSGASNFLWITAGGAVVASNSYLGYNLTGTNNEVLVSEPGSVWSNSGDLAVGSYGSSNTLAITSGGKVYNNSGNVGYFADSDNNAVTVTGNGSVWSNRNDLAMGYWNEEGLYNGGNTLTISNGGAVYCANGSAFNIDGDPDVSTVVVTGSGSVWSNSGDLTLGYAELTVAAGGAVYSAGGSIIGSVLVTGIGSVWSNSGSLFWYGGELTITNGGAVYSGGGDLWTFIQGFITIEVTDPGSVWNIAGSIDEDSSGDQVSLTITNGGVVYSGGVTMEGNYTSEANVTGAGSVLNIAGGLDISRGCFMGISDDGVVIADGAGGNALNITVARGGLYVTNGTGIIYLGGEFGSVTLNGGTVTANQLVVNKSEFSANPFILESGLFASGGTSVTNGESFGVGDGMNGAIFELIGGFHSFADGLVINSNSFLTGCGTIDGSVVVEPGGAVVANCGGTLTFTGTVTNNGSIFAVNGTFINFYGPVINDGSLVTTNGSVRFWAGIVNYGSLVLDPSGDADGDGIPNGWAQQYFGHPLGQASDLSRAGDDPDGDGMSNLQEYLAGTDPTNSGWYLHITSMTPQDNDLLVTWMMGPGKTNALQATAGALNGTYSTNGFADIFIVTNTVGTITNYLDLGAATNGPTRYYRVRLVP